MSKTIQQFEDEISGSIIQTPDMSFLLDSVGIHSAELKDQPSAFLYSYWGKTIETFAISGLFNDIKKSQEDDSRKILGDSYRDMRISRFSGITNCSDTSKDWKLHSPIIKNEITPSVVLEHKSKHENKNKIASIDIYHHEGKIHNSQHIKRAVVVKNVSIYFDHPVVNHVVLSFVEHWEHGVWIATEVTNISINLNRFGISQEKVLQWLDKYAPSGLDLLNGKVLKNPAEDFHFITSFARKRREHW